MRIFHTECGQQWGGQELRSLIEVEAANAAGHQAWAIVHEHGKMAEYAEKRDTPHYRISMKSSVDVKGFAQMAKLVAKHRPDVICCHNARDFYLSFPFRAVGIPLIRYRHISAPVKATWSRSFAYRTGSNAVVATAEFIKNQLVVQNGVDPRHITVIGEGVDLSRFNLSVDGSAARAEFGFTADQLVVGQVGMIRADKGFDDLIRAASLLRDSHPQVRFLFVGGPTRDGKYLREMQDLATKQNVADRIIFTGWREDVPQLMAACDVITLVSTGVEGQSRVIPEAFALKKPVIGSRLGGIPELVDHEHTGLLVPPRSPKDIAAAITRYAEEVALRERCALAGYDLAQSTLDINKRMEESYALYRSL